MFGLGEIFGYFTSLPRRQSVDYPEFLDYWSTLADGHVQIDGRHFARIIRNLAAVFDVEQGRRIFKSGSDAYDARWDVYKGMNSLVQNNGVPDFQFSKPELKRILSACNILGLSPQEKFRKVLIEQTRAAFSDGNFVNNLEFLGLFSNLAIYPGDDWIKDCWNGVLPHLTELENRDFHRAVYSFAKMDCLRSEQEDLRSTESPARKSGLYILSLYQEHKEAIFSDGLIPQSVSDSALWFDVDFSGGAFFPESGNSMSSRGEFYFLDQFRAARAKVSRSLVRTGSGHEFNLSLEFQGVSIAVEIDGLSHYLWRISDENPGFDYDGSTRIQTALMEKTMPEDARLVRIPAFHLWEGRRIPRGKIVNSVLGNFTSVNGNPTRVIMHDVGKFVPTSNPACWSLSAG